MQTQSQPSAAKGVVQTDYSCAAGRVMRISRDSINVARGKEHGHCMWARTFAELQNIAAVRSVLIGAGCGGRNHPAAGCVPAAAPPPPHLHQLQRLLLA